MLNPADLNPTQRQALAAAADILERSSRGYRQAYKLNARREFACQTINALLKAGLLERREFGAIGLTPAGRTALATSKAPPYAGRLPYAD